MAMTGALSGDQHLRALLKEIRTNAGLRQSDLAERLGQPQSYVSKYESGERRLDFLELRQICAAVGISLSAFVELFEKNHDETTRTVSKATEELLGKRSTHKSTRRLHPKTSRKKRKRAD